MTASRGPHDKVAGILTLVVAGLILSTAVLMIVIVGPTKLLWSSEPREHGLRLLLVFSLTELAVTIAAGLGILRGAKWGFVLGVILYGSLLLASNIVTVIGLAGLAYCVVRLANGLGPRETVPPPDDPASQEEFEPEEFYGGP